MGDDGTCSDLRTFADAYAGKHDGAHPEVAVIFDHDRPQLDGSTQDRDAAARFTVERGDDPNARSDADASADVDAPGAVEESLLTDPCLVPDSHAVLVVALENRLMAYVDVRTELDVLRVKDEDSRFEDTVGTASRKLVDAE